MTAGIEITTSQDLTPADKAVVLARECEDIVEPLDTAWGCTE